MNYEINLIKESVQKKGFFLIKNFLKDDDIKNLKRALDFHTKKNSNESFISIKGIDIFKSIFQLDKIKFKKSIITRKIKKKYNLSRIASDILGKKIELFAIDSYKSKINTGMVIPWHTDQAYSGRHNITENEFVDPDKSALKFFFYLTNVDSDNGCLGYIPGSHKISYALKKIILEKKINYSPYWNLEDYRKLILNKKVNSLMLEIISEHELKKFLEYSSFISTVNKDTKIFDIDAPEGSLLIFDEAGVHRGATLKKSDRLCLRYFFRKI